MIIGIGLDFVELARIDKVYQRFGTAFVNRLLHTCEQTSLASLLTKSAEIKLIEFLAARFAAKEAAVKALGTGFSQGIGLHDIHIISLPSGAPTISFLGKAQIQMQTLMVNNAHVSLTHSRNYAAAVVVLEHLETSAP